MTTLDELLARSRSPGTFVEQRTFTLARDKAVEKMREFALRWPEAACLEIVQAANLGRARFLAVDTTSRQLVVAWVGGHAYTEAELENLFDHLFIDQADLSRRHLFQLAVGINGLLQTRPAALRVESGDGTPEGTFRLEIDTNQQIKVGRTGHPMEGTYVYMQRRLGLNTLFRPGAHGPELSLIETRCKTSPAPLLVNGGSPIGLCSRTGYVAFGAKTQARFDLGVAKGTLTPDFPSAVMVIGGVIVCEQQVLDGEFGGIIADNRLRKTADMSSIVEDRNWIRLQHELLPTARRVRGKDWRPTNLPPLPDDEPPASQESAPRGPEPEPLPDVLFQVSPRSPIDRDRLLDPLVHGPQEPLFFVEEANDRMIEACDPLKFPYRVLTLSRGQAVTLAETFPQLARLTQPQDVTFVQQALERGNEVSVHRIDDERVCKALGIGQNSATYRLEIRLHLRGHEPRWDTRSSQPGTPLLVCGPERSILCASLVPPLPHISLVLHVPPEVGSGVGFSSFLPKLWPLVREEILGVLKGGLDDEEHGGRLVRNLLHTFARPSFERTDSGSVVLQLQLPTAWGASRQRLLDTPLLDTTRGPLSLSGLAALQGTEEVRDLASAEDEAVVAPLETRLGHGHLRAPGPRRSPMLIVGRTGSSWNARDLASLGSATELIFVDELVRSDPPPEGWRAEPTPAPFLAHWVHESERSTDRSGGFNLLSEEIDQHLHAGQEQARGAEHRRLDILQTAALHLARLTGQPGRISLIDQAGRRRTPSDFLKGTGLRIQARGGLATREPGIISLTLAELQALEQLLASMGHEAPLPLLSDDSPDVWAAPDEQVWLIREPVQVPGLDGWIGLQFPFDPTPSVLLETPSRTEVLTPTTTEVPCAGVVKTAIDGELHPTMLQPLRLAALRLYKRLLPLLDPESDADPEHREAARDYLGRYLAARLVLRPHEQLSGLAHSFAHRVRLPEPNQAWTVQRWAEADPASRPPLPDSWTQGLPPRAERAPLDVDERITASATRALNEQLTMIRGRATQIDLVPSRATRLQAMSNSNDRVTVMIDESDPDLRDMIQGDELGRLRVQLRVIEHLRQLGVLGIDKLDCGALALAVSTASLH